MSASIESLERCAVDSVEGNVANALQILRGRTDLGEPLGPGDIDAIDIRLSCALARLRNARAFGTTAGELSILARRKIEQFRIRPLPSFPCRTTD